MMRSRFQVFWFCLCLFFWPAVSWGQSTNAVGYPVPSEPNQLFFLQRSMNSNTIVYAANLGSGGKLDKKDPIEIFWRRYNDNGEKLPLSLVERQLAFGVNAKRVPNEPDTYLVTLRAYAKRSAVLRMVDGTPRLETKVAGQDARLISAYLYLDENETPPRVIKVDLRGEALETRQLLLETFIP